MILNFLRQLQETINESLETAKDIDDKVAEYKQNILSTYAKGVFYMPMLKAFVDITDIDENKITLQYEDKIEQLPLYMANNILKDIDDNRPRYPEVSYKQILLISNLRSEISKFKSACIEKTALNKFLAILADQAKSDAKNNKKPLYSYFKGISTASTQLENKFQKFAKMSCGQDFKLDSYVEFKDVYVTNYEQAKVEQKQMKSRQHYQRRIKDAILTSYPGNVDDLITWIKANILRVDIKAPKLTEEEEDILSRSDSNVSSQIKGKQSSINRLKSQLFDLEKLGKIATGFKVNYIEGQWYSSWTVYLKTGAEASMPAEVEDWAVLKKAPGDGDAFEMGNVYNKDTNTITSNPIVQDLVYNYDFKLGKN